MKRFLVFVAVLVVLAGCDSAGSMSPPPPSAAAPTVVVGFVTANQDKSADRVRFADNNGRVWGDVPVSPEADFFTWSNDNRYFAWIDGQRVHVVEAATGTDSTQPCACNGLSWLGDRFVTATTDGTALELFDGSATPERIPLRQPMNDPTVVAGGADRVLVAESVPDEKANFRREQTVHALNKNGLVDITVEGSADGRIIDRVSPDGTQFLAAEAYGGDECFATYAAAVLPANKTTPKAKLQVPSDAPFAEAVLGKSRTITSATWAGSTAVITFGPTPNCQAMTADRYVTYALTDTTWQYLRSGAVATGYGAEGRSYAIEANETALKANMATGTLVLTSNGRKELGINVRDFQVTPAEERAGKPQVVAREDKPITTTDHGQPIPQAFTDLQHQVSQALEHNDTAELTRLCSTCDTATKSLVTTPSGRDSLRQSLRTHPAVFENTAVYPGLTVNRCRDGMQPESLCTGEQIRDVGLLGLKDQGGDKIFLGWNYAAPAAGSVRFTLVKDGVARWVGQIDSGRAPSVVANQYLQKDFGTGQPSPSYFFKSPDDSFLCGVDKDGAGCQGSTTPVPPRPPSCEEGPAWGGGMTVTSSGKVDYLCAGGLMYYSSGREPRDSDRLPYGRAISVLGFTCTAQDGGIRCVQDHTGHGFFIAPKENKPF